MINLSIKSLVLDGQIEFFTQHTQSKVDEVYHKHDFYEIFFITEGTIKHIYNKTSQDILNTGDIVLIRPSDEHVFKRFSDNNCAHMDIAISVELFESACYYFDKSLFDKINSYSSPLKTKIESKQILNFEKEINNISLFPSDKLKISESRIKLLIIELIYCFVENSISNNGNMPEWLQTFILKLGGANNFHTSTQDLINETCYNKSYVCRTFKTYMNCTISEYLLDSKLNYAAFLLKLSNYSIKQICEIINIESSSYFTKMFKKKFGVTPKKIKYY